MNSTMISCVFLTTTLATLVAIGSGAPTFERALYALPDGANRTAFDLLNHRFAVVQRHWAEQTAADAAANRLTHYTVAEVKTVEFCFYERNDHDSASVWARPHWTAADVQRSFVGMELSEIQFTEFAAEQAAGLPALHLCQVLTTGYRRVDALSTGIAFNQYVRLESLYDRYRTQDDHLTKLAIAACYRNETAHPLCARLHVFYDEPTMTTIERLREQWENRRKMAADSFISRRLIECSQQYSAHALCDRFQYGSDAEHYYWEMVLRVMAERTGVGCVQSWRFRDKYQRQIDRFHDWWAVYW